MNELTFVSIQMPVETDNDLRKIAAELRISRSNLVRQAINKYINDYYRIVSLSILPCPEGGTTVPMLTVVQVDEAQIAAAAEAK